MADAEREADVLKALAGIGHAALGPAAVARILNAVEGKPCVWCPILYINMTASAWATENAANRVKRVLESLVRQGKVIKLRPGHNYVYSLATPATAE